MPSSEDSIRSKPAGVLRNAVEIMKSQRKMAEKSGRAGRRFSAFPALETFLPLYYSIVSVVM
jgi:hypothetical protein